MKPPEIINAVVEAAKLIVRGDYIPRIAFLDQLERAIDDYDAAPDGMWTPETWEGYGEHCMEHHEMERYRACLHLDRPKEYNNGRTYPLCEQSACPRLKGEPNGNA